MLALRWNSNDQVALENINEPLITSTGDVKIKVYYGAVCTSDVHIAKGAFGEDFPKTLGHEISGEIVETGTAVTKLKTSDKVAMQPTIWCGECDACREANIHLCPNRKFIGLNHDGGFAEYMTAPERNFIKVSEKIDLKEACLIEPLACVLHAVKIMSPKENDTFVITGAGPSAYIFAAVLLNRGVKSENILVSGRRDIRLEVIKNLGIETVDVRKDDFYIAVEKKFGCRGPEYLIDQTGDLEIISTSLDFLARRGKLFIYDYMGKAIPFDFGKMQLREITILTSTGCPDTIPDAVSLLEENEIDMTKIMTHEFSKEDMLEAFKKAQTKDQSHIKSIINFCH